MSTPARLDAIQKRLEAAPPGTVTITPSDVAFLLGLAQEQALQLARARGLVNTWGEYPSSPEGRCAFELRMAVGAA